MLVHGKLHPYQQTILSFFPFDNYKADELSKDAKKGGFSVANYQIFINKQATIYTRMIKKYIKIGIVFNYI